MVGNSSPHRKEPSRLGPDVAPRRQRALRLKRRLVWTLGVLCALLVASIILSVLYAQVYSLPFGMPEIHVSAVTLASTYAALIPTLGVLAAVVILLGNERVSASTLTWWERQAAHPHRALWVSLTTAAVGAIAFAFIRVAWGEQVEGWELSELTAGEGTVPFQYRTLIPWLVRGAGALGVVELESVAQLQVAYGVIEAIAALGAVLAFGALLRALSVRDAHSHLASLTLFYPLFFSLAAPYRYANLFFPWDTASVAFFAFGVVLLLRRQRLAYYVLFAVATLNRETTCFLSVIMVLIEWKRLPLSMLGRHVAAQFVLWTAIKGGLVWVYADNLAYSAGYRIFWLMVESNLDVLRTVPGLVYLPQAMGGLWIVVLMLFPWLREPRLQRALLVAVPFCIGMLLAGIVLEIRVFSELIPLVLAGFLFICRSIMRLTLAGGDDLGQRVRRGLEVPHGGWQRTCTARGRTHEPARVAP